MRTRTVATTTTTRPTNVTGYVQYRVITARSLVHHVLFSHTSPETYPEAVKLLKRLSSFFFYNFSKLEGCHQRQTNTSRT